MKAIVPALLSAAILAGSGCAIAGKRAAQGAQESFQQSQAAAAESGGPARVAGERAVRGAAQELASPQTTAEIGVAVDAAVERGLARIHRELSGGQGRFARDLDATADRVSTAAMRGVRRELDEAIEGALGGCEGLDRRACLRREVHALGREASAGFLDGIVSSHAWATALIFFASGAAAALLLRTAWDHLPGRARPATRGGARA